MAAPIRLVSPVGVACLVVFLHYTGAYMRMPLLPLYARAGGASPGQVGVMMGAFMVMAACTALPGGVLADRFGRKRLIAAGLAISVATSLILPLGDGIAFLTPLMALAGGAMAAFTPAAMASVVEGAGADRAGRGYGWYTTALYGGLSAGPALGGLAADALGFHRTFVASGGVVLAALGLAAAGLPAAGGPRAPARRPRGGLVLLARDPVALACCGAMFCLTFAWGVLLTFFPLYAADQGLTRRAIGGLFALQALANVGMRAPVGYLSDKLGVRAPFVTAGMLGFAAAMGALPLLHGSGGLALAMTMSGFGQGVSAVATGAALGEATDPSVRGAAMGGYSTALYAGMAAGAFLAGPVIARAGFTAGFVLAAALLVAGAVGFQGLMARAPRAR